MFRVYQTLRSQYYWIHSLYCVISFLILVLLGRVWLFDNDVLVAWQTSFIVEYIESVLIIISASHAWCLWVSVKRMRKVLARMGKQQNIDERQRRVFGLSDRDIYLRYGIDLCFFNTLLADIFFLATHSLQ